MVDRNRTRVTGRNIESEKSFISNHSAFGTDGIGKRTGKIQIDGV